MTTDNYKLIDDFLNELHHYSVDTQSQDTIDISNKVFLLRDTTDFLEGYSIVDFDEILNQENSINISQTSENPIITNEKFDDKVIYGYDKEYPIDLTDDKQIDVETLEIKDVIYINEDIKHSVKEDEDKSKIPIQNSQNFIFIYFNKEFRNYKTKLPFKTPVLKQIQKKKCPHKNDFVCCFLCKKKNKCLHEKDIKYCQICLKCNLKLIKICKSTNCLNRVDHMFLDDMCQSCYKFKYPKEYNDLILIGPLNFVQNVLYKIGELYGIQSLYIPVKYNNMMVEIRLYNYGSFFLILYVEEQKFTPYDQILQSEIIESLRKNPKIINKKL